jgi:hypothetical protein
MAQLKTTKTTTDASEGTPAPSVDTFSIDAPVAPPLPPVDDEPRFDLQRVIDESPSLTGHPSYVAVGAFHEAAPDQTFTRAEAKARIDAWLGV